VWRGITGTTVRAKFHVAVHRCSSFEKKWADELDWATKVVDTKIEDAEIGNYTAPGLHLQQETVRLFLEPVARAAPGTEGVVDLYLMPSYDDIASLYYYDNRWNVHYRLEADPSFGNIPTRPSNVSAVTDVRSFDHEPTSTPDFIVG